MLFSSAKLGLPAIFPTSFTTARLLHTTTTAMAIQRVKVASGSEAPRSGTMKDFVFAGEGDDAVKVLVTNVNGKLHATSAKCTHYGAPLANGILTSTGKIVCPWHGACFDAKSGDIEDAPALDNLLSLKLEQDNDGNIFVEADADKLKGKPGVPVSCKGSASAKQGANGGFVIIGGGSAGINAIESARKAGYEGPISLFTAEQHTPLDRTKLSKALIDSADKLIWRDEQHLKDTLKVSFKQNARASSVDVEKKEVSFEDGSKVQFETLLLAPGATAKRLPVPGAKQGELENVFTLRNVEDVQSILKALGGNKDKNLVIIGTSFIGMEVAIAASGQEKAKKVSVIGMEKVPFEKILGAEVGEGLMKAQQKKGIEFHNQAGVEKIEGRDGKVSAVVIKDESGKQVSLDADVVLLGVGAAPATEFLKNSKGFPDLLKDGSVAVDKNLRVKGIASQANIFACGDIATVPARSEEGQTVRIEHWNVAGNHGRTVGQIVAGQTANIYEVMPIFWSALGAQLRYVSDGNPPGSDDIYVDGNAEELKFAAYYSKNGKVNAVCTMGVDPLMVHSAELMRTGKMPSLADIKKGNTPLNTPLSNL
jgi:NADPH-dependent 2,4-dienoyl-CoA reductase/sulfur reductase-like enzyme/nitrite reductase/ring-hydroxylating ferredoxin subunit